MASRVAVRRLRLAALACVLALASVGIAGPASAHGGSGVTEGYVIVQQALGNLYQDAGAAGIAKALAKVDEVLVAEDQDGVDIAEVRLAKSAIEAGNIDQGRTLLQEAITVAIAELKPATGEETGTTVMVGPLQNSKTLTGWDSAFLVLSALAILIGAGLAILFRPQYSLHDLRQSLIRHPTGTPGPSAQHEQDEGA